MKAPFFLSSLLSDKNKKKLMKLSYRRSLLFGAIEACNFFSFFKKSVKLTIWNFEVIRGSGEGV